MQEGKDVTPEQLERREQQLICKEEKMQEGKNVTLELLERREKDWHPGKERSRSFRAAAGRQDRKSIAPDHS